MIFTVQTKDLVHQIMMSNNDVPISRVEAIKDLGIYLDSKLNYVGHIEHICNRSLKLLGFVRKFTTDFNDRFVIIHLYKTLVLPILLYASPVWSPYLLCDIKKLEPVQHNFLRYLAFKSGRPINPFDHDYSSIMQRYAIPSLASRRRVNDV